MEACLKAEMAQDLTSEVGKQWIWTGHPWTWGGSTAHLIWEDETSVFMTEEESLPETFSDPEMKWTWIFEGVLKWIRETTFRILQVLWVSLGHQWIWVAETCRVVILGVQRMDSWIWGRGEIPNGYAWASSHGHQKETCHGGNGWKWRSWGHERQGEATDGWHWWFNMDMPPRDRPMMDFDRRGVTPPLNPRGRFESDMDLRNRMGSSNDFRDQPPQMFRDNEGVPMDIRGRPDMPLGRGGPEPMIRPDEMTIRDREFPEPMDSPMGFRGRESETLSDEWRKHGMRDRESLPPMMGRTPPLFQRELQEKLFSNCGKDVDFGERPQLKDRDRDGFLGKDGSGFNRSERDSKHQNWEKNNPSDFPVRDPTQKPPLIPLDPPLNAQSRDGDKPWPGDRDEKPDRTAPAGSRPPYFQDKNQPNQEHHFASDRVPFKGSSDMALDQGPQRESLVSGPKEPQSNRGERQDQDYRDIDYRTSSGRKYDYNLGDLQGPEKDVKESKLGPTQRPDDSGSQVRFCLLILFDGKHEFLFQLQNHSDYINVLL